MNLNNQKTMNCNSPHIYLCEHKLEPCFEIKEKKLYLKGSKAKSIRVEFPFKFDENIAKIAGMTLDGSLNKNFSSVTFSQKKDPNKVTEFAKIITKLFGVFPVFSKHNDAPNVTFSNKTLAVFFSKHLDIHKSNEEARIPYWIWNSPKSVIIEYLRYAFAMEGSIDNYLKGSEIKFNSVSLPHLKELKNILKNKFDINSNIQRYCIKDYGWKYYLCFSKQEEIVKFNEIGFALESHQRRLTELISSYKNKAWEITLVNILNLNKRKFVLPEVGKFFSYLCKRAIHHRLTDLVKRGYLEKKLIGYSMTDKGHKIALALKKKVKTTELRTYPKRNEEKIIEFLNTKRRSYRNEIARELKISPITIRDTLKRMVGKNKIELVEKDKFQRKFYILKKENGCGITTAH